MTGAPGTVGAATRRVLIAGGGFVGLYTALALERLLEPAEAELELVAPENFMLYQPMLPEVASGAIEPRHAVVPLRRALRRTRVTAGKLSRLDHPSRTATVSPITGRPRTVDYDVLVIGLGSVTRTLDVPGLVGHAVGFQTLAEAIHLRNQVLARLEAAETVTDRDLRRRELTFVFVGGGYAGVEALAELEWLARNACRSYRSISAADMRWVLIEATDRILPSLHERLAQRAAAVLRARGIEIRLGTTLESVVDGVIRLSDADEIPAGTLVWMPGVVPSPDVKRLGLPCDDRGRLSVDAHLRVPGCEGIWGAGDCAAVPRPGEGRYPPTAQHAEREARHLARNLAATLRGDPTVPFQYRSRGEFVTLGDRRGVADVFGLPLGGAAAWGLRRSYYLARMPTVERRVRLLVDWLAGLPFEVDIAQLGSEQHPDLPLASGAAAGSD